MVGSLFDEVNLRYHMADILSGASPADAGDEQQNRSKALQLSADPKTLEGNGSDPEQTDVGTGKPGQPEASGVPMRPTSWPGPQKRYPAVFGIIGFIMWMLCFSTGVLLDSTPYRIVTDSTYRQAVLAKQAGNNDTPESASLLKRAKRLEEKPARFWSTIRAYFRGFSYTPINLALLCFWAGLIGGASSRLSYERALNTQGPPSRISIEDYSKIQLHYLRESPLSSALRSFVVYLALLSGFYLAAGDPFKDMNSS